MKKIIFVLLLATAAGCSKEINSSALNTSTGNQLQNRISADTYLPLTPGTSWNYRIVENEVDPKRSKLTVLTAAKTINGKNYQKIKSRTDHEADTIFYAQDVHNYYVYTNSGTSDADKVNLEILFLKDDAAVGATWTVPAGNADGVTLRCYGKIIEKNTSIKVSGVVYKDVIHSYVELRKPLLFTYIVVSKQDFYVAKNIGIVKNVTKFLLPEVSENTTNLTEYKIN